MMKRNNLVQQTLLNECSQESVSQAIGQLVQEHEKFLKSFIARRVWDAQNVDDVYQSTLLEAVKSFPKFRNESQPRTWLCGIAYNVIRNYARNLNVIHCDSLEVLDSEEVDSASMVADDPADIYIRDQFVSKLKDESNKLPTKVRQTFSLVIESGKSYEQAAQLLNVPIGTVRSRIARAREVLKVNCSL